MNKFLLLIDDKEEFKDSFLIEAQSKGYRTAWGRSKQELEEKIPLLNRKITAIILDVKCLLTNNQEIENNNFIGAALSFLDRNYKHLPRVILTGDEEAFTNANNIFSESELIFKKDPTGLNNLFIKLDEFHQELPNRLMTIDEKEILSLIDNSEGRILEFKSALQYDFFYGKKNKSGHHNILKSLAAFSNSDGGVLLLGVNDDKSICGLEDGDFSTLVGGDKEDAYKLLLDELVQTSFGNDFQSNLEAIKFYKVKGKTVCKIVVKGKHSSPIYINMPAADGTISQVLFIRGQASTRKLNDNEVSSYLKNNWPERFNVLSQ
ncbi:AlbA family DNA-binding domain-containing protein [Sphingobacterium pedocola]|nr:ATP-binding protein [Sphingobacterium pedocola]